LQGYKGCAAWQERVDDNPETLKQMELFLGTPLMASLAFNVSERLGFKYNLTLGAYHIQNCTTPLVPKINSHYFPIDNTHVKILLHKNENRAKI
jgi:hypothetical protein